MGLLLLMRGLNLLPVFSFYYIKMWEILDWKFVLKILKWSVACNNIENTSKCYNKNTKKEPRNILQTFT